jgi:F420-non-reducing hydrogenase small subunit
MANPDKVVPEPKSTSAEGDLTIPEFYNTVKTLAQVVDVDYYMPGCPPTPRQVWNVVQAIVGGQLPAKGAVIGASEKTQCDECPRKKQEKKITAFKRIATAQPDPDICFLEQGFLCLGPVTRGGCDARCMTSGVPCRGCFGPPDGVVDMGAKAISAIASVIEAKEEAEVERIIQQIPDTLRSFNRFGIAASLIPRKII